MSPNLSRYLDVSAIEAELARRGHGTYTQFRKTYRNDPIAFMHDCLIWKSDKRLTDYQEEIIGLLPEKKRESVRGPHGLGKTFMAASLVHWFALTRDGDDDWKCPTMASAWRQLTKFLWPEIHKLARLIDWSKVGRAPYDPRTELQALSLKLSTGEAFAIASDNHELIEGVHADSLLYMFDEAKAIPAATLDAAEGAFSNAGSDAPSEALAFMISTPGDMQGRFYDIQTRKPGTEDWHVRPVKLEECVNAGRISQDWADQRRRQWGEHSTVFQNRVMGEFASSAEDHVIPLNWVEQAVERWHAWKEAEKEAALAPDYQKPLPGAIGADIADQGEDNTVFAPRIGNVVPKLEAFSGMETMETAGRLKQYHDRNPNIFMSVDVIGIGAGVVSRLREQNVEVYAFNAAHGTDDTDQSGTEFLNKRSAAWWNMREMLDPDNRHNVALPDDPELIGDLTAPRWKLNSAGKYQVEGAEPTTLFPDGLRKRLGRSPDKGTAVVQAFYVPHGAQPPMEEKRDYVTAQKIQLIERRLHGPKTSFEVTR